MGVDVKKQVHQVTKLPNFYCAETTSGKFATCITLHG